jgi:aspartyl/asparaginyl beta-hydroxylase (cupin superfamily)
MLSKILIVTGGAVWALVAVSFALGILNRPRVRRWLERPGLYPYTHWLRSRIQGAFLHVLARLGSPAARRVAPEVVKAFRTARVDEFKQLRAVMHEVEALPTVQRGLAELGIDSIFEVPNRAVHTIKSPYTARLQKPSYYIPGVPAHSFYEPADFPWVKPLEDAFPTIKRELMGVLNQNGKGFKTYMSESNQHLDGWNTFNFFFYGKRFDENCALCPETAALLESLPRFERDHVMFSALNPHAHIPPHTGPMNGIIRGHLALVAPEGCYIKVGPDERTWEEGKVLVFDDSYVHEVWNHSPHVRIVLFMNFWHPCFSTDEIAVLERFRVAYERSPLGRVHEDNQAAQRAHDVAMQAIARATAAASPAAVPAAR